VISRIDLVDDLNAYLCCDQYSDYAPNGLQVEGRSQVQRICTAVSASAEVIQAAVDFEADALLVHHGFFWKNESPCLVGIKRSRIAMLLNHQVNLLAYHLPLDCHPEVGNNARLASLLAVKNVSQFAVGQTPGLLWLGDLSVSTSAVDWQRHLTDLFDRTPQMILGGDHTIQRIAWCSGAAQDFIEQAAALGADAYLSGEVSERTYYQAKELGIHYVAAGHHATERYGVQKLGEFLAQKYQLTHCYIETDNPV